MSSRERVSVAVVGGVAVMLYFVVVVPLDFEVVTFCLDVSVILEVVEGEMAAVVGAVIAFDVVAVVSSVDVVRVVTWVVFFWILVWVELVLLIVSVVDTIVSLVDISASSLSILLQT